MDQSTIYENYRESDLDGPAGAALPPEAFAMCKMLCRSTGWMAFFNDFNGLVWRSLAESNRSLHRERVAS